MRRIALVLSLLFSTALLPLCAQHASAKSQLLAATPPMGWNSWDSYGLTITEAQFKTNVDWLNKNLKAYGWQYVVIDEGWYLNHPDNKGKPAWEYTVSKDGRYMPSASRFPSSANGAGFKPLADSIHARGLKFGIHIIRGIPREAVDKNLPIAGSSFHAADAADKSDTCAWNPDNYGVKANAAGQAYYDSLARLYAGWGLDFIKVDCISSPYKDDEIRMMSLALQKTGRPIVFSLSPGPTPVDKQGELVKYAQMWRISTDVWDTWKHAEGKEWAPQGVGDQFALTTAWAGHAQPGRWPDADMLPLGHLGPVAGWGPARDTNLTPDEQHTLLNLWAIFRSPLFIGSNFAESNASLTPLLTNREILAIDQHSTKNHPVVNTPRTVIWSAQPQTGKGHYLAVFNTGDTAQTVAYSWKDLELKQSSYKVRDLWQHKDMGAAKSLSIALKPHASVMYNLSPVD